MCLKENITCPLCPDAEPMPLLTESREFSVKGVKVTAEFFYYKCHTCGEGFTTTESDTVSLENVYKAYNDISN